MHRLQHLLAGLIHETSDLGVVLHLPRISMTADDVLVFAAAAGAACREPLQLPLPPLALSSAGLFVVAVCDDGVYAFDRNSSRQVQQIEYAHDDTYVGLSQRLPTAADAGGRCICLATSSLVLWLEPVALEQQVGPRHQAFLEFSWAAWPHVLAGAQ